MGKLTQKEWSQENKHDLRDLYSSFLRESGATLEEFQAGKCVSYSDFQDFMYGQTVHAK